MEGLVPTPPGMFESLQIIVANP